MGLILLAQRHVNCNVALCSGDESVALVNTVALRKPLLQVDGFYAKETAYSPDLFILKTEEELMHAVDVTLFE